MRLIDADELLKHEVEADRMGAMLVVGKGHILSAPTINAVRVVHGCWEFVNDYESMCTACGELSLVDHTSEPKFCLNCGAKMGKYGFKDLTELDSAVQKIDWR